MTVNFYYTLRCILFCFLFLLLPSVVSAAAKSIPELSLPMDGKISEYGTTVELNWKMATATNIDSVIIQRRILGKTNKESWQVIATFNEDVQVYLDKEIKLGIAYEYRISRTCKEQVETGYWTTGRNLTAQENRGTAIVVVDETLIEDLGAHLDRFLLDLIGDGWTVVRHDVPRGDNINKKKSVDNLKAARKIKSWIQDRYYSNSSVSYALILVGHIPLVKSGQSKPDGHTLRPLETDLFYADMNGAWLDNGQGILSHNVIPSSSVEMQVGRIDFSNMDGKLGNEISLLKQYFDKNHHWRHGLLGDLREAYGGNGYLSVETNGLRNIVGPNKLSKGGHHDTGTQQPWLFGVDFGSYKYSDYTSATPIKAVFSINFGSGKLDFSNWNNTMKAMLAQQWYCLVTGWGSRPAWQLHHMALGKSIGYSHLRTVNNGTITLGGLETREYTPTGDYAWLNSIWVNLLGDPTLHLFPLQSVRELQAERHETEVKLSWAKKNSNVKMQYRVYRALEKFGPYELLNPLKLLSESQYIDPTPITGAWYMVRAHALKEVYAGSFYTFSQGAFATAENVPTKAIDQFISTPIEQEIAINTASTDSKLNNQFTTSFINVSRGGHLAKSDNGWSFTPYSGFTGLVEIPFTIFDGVSSDVGVINIDVVDM